jgi:hypothetical protein
LKVIIKNFDKKSRKIIRNQKKGIKLISP